MMPITTFHSFPPKGRHLFPRRNPSKRLGQPNQETSFAVSPLGSKSVNKAVPNFRVLPLAQTHGPVASYFLVSVDPTALVYCLTTTNHSNTMHSCCLPCTASHSSHMPVRSSTNLSTLPHHHHHSRLLYILNDSSLGRLPLSRVPNETPPNITSTTRLSLPSISLLSHPPSIQTNVANQPSLSPPHPANSPRPSAAFSLATVEDCCSQCCPLTQENDTQQTKDAKANNQKMKPLSILPSSQNRSPSSSKGPSVHSQSGSHSPATDDEPTEDLMVPAVRNRRQSYLNEDATTTSSSTVCKWASCSTTFRSVDELTPHLFKNHLNSRATDFSCHWESCKVAVDDSDALVSHLTNHLGERMIHVCRWVDCGQRFVSFDELTDHLSDEHVGAGRSEYCCDWEECDRQGKIFTQRQKVMRHIQTHTGDKPYQCTVCKKRFSEANIMTQHMRTHTGEKPYKCPEKDCSREFSISGALTIHRRVHSGEKPFTCKYQGCEKRFAESSNLTKHTRVHTGERPFRCSIAPCGKSFSRPDQVSRHLKTHKKDKNELPHAKKQKQ